VTSRDRTLIALGLGIALVVAAWFVVIQPKRNEASKLGSTMKSAQSQLDAARAQVAAGEAARSTYARNYAQLTRLGEAVPADDNVPSLIYQVQSAASAAKVDFRTLALNSGGTGSSAQPVSTPGGAAARANSAGATSSNGSTSGSAGSGGTHGSSSSSAAASAPSAPATQSATAALPPGATVGPAGFPVEPFTFTFRGNFFHLSDFLGRLERFVRATNKNVRVSGRLMTLNAISLGPGSSGFPQITASISATTYLVPSSQGLTGGGTASGPAGGGSTQVSTSSSGGSTTPAVATPPR
jgi:Type II secretion system (T2SS), protein M